MIDFDDHDCNYASWPRDRLDREALAAQNPDHVGHLDPRLRHWAPEPLGSHQSDARPKPAYWDHSGIDRVNSEFSRVVKSVFAFLFLVFAFAVMFVGFGGLELIGWARRLL